MPEDGDRDGAEDVVVVGRRLVVRVHVIHVDTDLHVVRGDDHQRGRSLPLLVVVPGGAEIRAAPRAVLLLHPHVHEVRHGGRAPAHRGGSVAMNAGLEQRRDERPRERHIRLHGESVELAQGVSELLRLSLAVLLRRRRVRQPRDAIGEVGVAREPPVGLVAVLGEPGKSHLAREIEPRGAARSRPGEDLNDAGGRFGPVQRCRGGALQDLDALDGLGVDVVDPGRIPAAAGADIVPPAAAAIDPHPIHVDNRLGRLGKAGGTPDADARAFAREPARGQNRDAGLARRELLGNVLDGGVDEVARVDRRDGVRYLASLRFGAGAGHHHRVESDRRRGQLEVHDRHLAGRHRHALGRAAEAHASDPHLRLAGRHVQLVLPGGVGQRREIGAHHEHLHRIHGAFVDAIGHGAADGAGALRGREGRATDQEADAPDERGRGPTKGRAHLHLLMRMELFACSCRAQREHGGSAFDI